MKLRYTRRGWFAVMEWLSGTVDFRTGVARPDEFGCFIRRALVGPYATATQAAQALRHG